MKARMFFILYLIMVIVGVGACLSLDVYTKESLEFISCEFNERFDCIHLVVKNTGTTNLEFVEVILNSRPYKHDPAGLFQEPVSAGETKDILILDHWSPYAGYIITLITKRGNAFSTVQASPERQPPLEIDTVTWSCTSNTVSVVVRNMGTKERKITYFCLRDALYASYDFVTPYTNIAKGIYVPINQTTTIVLDWPSNWSAWISDKTYYFCIGASIGPDTTFTSKPP